MTLSELEGSYKSITDLRDSIKQDVLFLLKTAPGEWPGNPDLGIGVRNYLFEPVTSPMWIKLHKRIKEQFATYLPFVEVQSDIANKDTDFNYAELIIKYKVDTLSISEVLNFGTVEEKNESFSSNSRGGVNI